MGDSQSSASSPSQSSMVGGSGGNLFDTGKNTSGVVEVTVWKEDGGVVRAIQLKNADGTLSQIHGHQKYHEKDKVKWIVPGDKGITGMKVNYNWLIDGMQFKAAGGCTSPWFAGEYGTKDIDVDFPDGHMLLGFRGRDDKSKIHAIEPIVGPAAPLLIGHPKLDLRLVFECDGGSSGYTMEKYRKGTKKSENSTYTSRLEVEIKVSTGALVAAFTSNLSAALKTEVSSSFVSSIEEHEEIEQEMRVNWEKPCYVYQTVVDAQTRSGSFRFLGAPIIRSQRLDRGAA